MSKIPRPTGPANVSWRDIYIVVAIYIHTFRMFTFCLMKPATWAPAIGIGAQQKRTSHANKQNITSTWPRRAGLAGPAPGPRPRPGAFLGRCAPVLRARGRPAAAALPVGSPPWRNRIMARTARWTSSLRLGQQAPTRPRRRTRSLLLRPVPRPRWRTPSTRESSWSV